MSQKLVSMTITEEQQAAALAAIAQLEAALPGLISLSPAQRKTLLHMGQKTEVFARGTLRVLEQNPRLVPASLDLRAAQVDLGTLDRLRPILDAMSRLNTRLNATAAGLGHDVMDVALDGYNQLKRSGDDHGLEALRKDLGARFTKTRRREEVPPV